MKNNNLNHQELLMKEASPATSVHWGRVKAISLLVTVVSGRSGELLSVEDEVGHKIIRLYSTVLPESKLHTYMVELFTDAKSQPLTMTVPLQVSQHSHHELLIRYNGYHLALFVDGVLVDEEWPIGAIDLRQAKVESYTGVTQTRLLSYAISEQEMTQLFGDQEYLHKKQNELLGAEPVTIQYWRPRGFNTSVGDCMPYYDGTTFHIFYLFDRRGHRSKWGLGAHQWAHMSTDNLKDWVHHPIGVGITEEWEGSICTGSVFNENNQYYAYYAVRAIDGSPARLTWATSSDGIHYEKSGRYIQLSESYRLSSVRDPIVFKDEERMYHMLVTTSIVEGDVQHGCLAHLTSKDLENWDEQSPFIVPGYHDEPECPDYFEWNGWYYLIFSNDGVARYRYSRNPFGRPWLRPAVDILDGIQMRVPKSAAYKNGRRLTAGFLSEPGKYGGELIIRELLQHSDGSLGTRYVDELTDRTGRVIDMQTFDGEFIEGDTVSLENQEGLAECRMTEIGHEYTLSFEVTPGYPNMYYGFSLADSGEFKQGRDIRFEPAARKFGIHNIYAPSFTEDEASSLYNVSGLEQRVVVEAVVRENFIDICINGQRTMISRLSKKYDYLRFYAQFGTAVFHNIKIRSLADTGSGGLQ